MTNESTSTQILRMQVEVDKKTLAESKRAFRELEGAGKQLVESNRAAIRLSDQYERIQREATKAAMAEAAAHQRNAEAIKKENQAREQAAKVRMPGGIGHTPREGRDASQRASTDYGRIAGGVNAIAALVPGNAGGAVRTTADVISVLDDLPRAAAEVKPALAALGGGIKGLAVAGGAGVAIAGLVAILDLQAKKAAEAQSRLNAAFDADLEANRLLASATTDQIQANLAKLAVDKQALALTIQQKEAEVEAAKATSGFARALLSVGEQFGFGPEQKLDEWRAQLNRAQESIDANNSALGSAEVAANDAAAAQAKLAIETARAAEATEAAIQAQQASIAAAALSGELDFYRAVGSGTTESIQAEIDAAKQRRDIIQRQMADVQEQLLSDPNSEALRRKNDELTTQYAELVNQISALTRSLKNAEVVERSRAQHAEAAAVKIADIEKTFGERRVQLAEQYAQKLDDLAKQALDVQENYQLRIADIREEFQKNEESEARRNAFDRMIRQLEQQDSLYDAIANRDFAAIARAKRQSATTSKIDALREQFEDNEKQLRLADQLADAARDRDRALANVAERTLEVQTDQLAAQQALTAELQRSVDAAKGLEGTLKRITSQLKEASSVAGGKKSKGASEAASAPPPKTPTARAYGGPLSAGEWAAVNELPGQRERFNGVMLPQGKGLFYPMQGGMVTNNNAGNVTIAPGAIVVNGARDPRATAREVQQALDNYFTGVHR